MAITATAATEMVTTAYSSTKFHQVLDLVPSNDEFKSRGGPQFVYDICRPLLRKHGLTSVFGVGLVHRHFDIDSDQKLVEFNNITLPWRTTTMTTAGGEDVEAKIHILPTAWMFDDQEQKWMPYEFSYSPMGKVEPVRLDDARYRDFLAEYACALKDAGLQKVVGLRLWPGEGFRGGLERTEGKANIWLVPGQVRCRGSVQNIKS